MIDFYYSILLFLSFIGLISIFFYLVDNLKSIVQIVLSLLTPYFQPAESTKLSEKFGQWAGN